MIGGPRMAAQLCRQGGRTKPVQPVREQRVGLMLWTIVKMMLKSLSMGYEKISCGLGPRAVEYHFGQFGSAFLGG
jgi:hypothetical protein